MDQASLTHMTISEIEAMLHIRRMNNAIQRPSVIKGINGAVFYDLAEDDTL